MQTPEPHQKRPETAREAAMKRRTFDMREVLGMRHIRTVTIGVAPTPEEPKTDPTVFSRP
jgi:hypothetical protein